MESIMAKIEDLLVGDHNTMDPTETNEELRKRVNELVKTIKSIQHILRKNNIS